MKCFLSRRWRPFLILTLLVLFLGTAAMPAFAAGGDLSALDLAKKGGNGRGNAFGHGKAPVFTDISADYWAWAYICKMGAKGVLKGYGNGLFGPLNNVTRLELVVMATRLLGYEEEALALTPAEVAAILRVFKDYPSFPVWPGVLEDLAYAQKEGYLWPLMQGKSDKTFRPYAPATRLEVVVVLLEAMGRTNEAKALMSAPINFKDASSVPAWAHGYVALAVKIGMLKGDKGCLHLARPVTRAEMAALLDRADDHADTDLDREVITGTVVDVRKGSGATPATITIVPGDDPGDDDAGEETYDLASCVVVIEDDKQGNLKDVNEGDFVALYFDENGLVLLIHIRESGDGDDDDDRDEASGILLGKVENGSGDLLSITLKDGKITKVYTVDPDVEITLDGEKVDADDLKVGQEIEVELEDGKVVSIDIISEPEDEDTTEVRGKVTAVDEASSSTDVSTISILKSGSGGTEVTYVVSDDADITVNGANADLGDVKIGSQVTLTLDKDNEVIAIEAVYTVSTAQGTITGKAVNSQGRLVSLTIRTGSRTVTYAVSSEADIFDDDGDEIEASDLRIGDTVKIEISQGLVIRIRVQ